ncbi:hypothetical protein [Methylocystis echinoides]|uniref:Uncharacterized protein n=1 Tax=Methylocystis echinoides TaxID=29468 RepID=A0A9W6GTS9_9HYPH|nr:hypothetical protein [Methylocystis echinoides]GLI92731.1 hypothetical protein LMG27198_17230 [Methylocystis echinoides]
MRKRLISNVVLGLLSGPVLAGLVLLVPLAVLTGLSAVLDPSLAMYEFVPEEALLLPFLLIAVLISVANARLAVVMSHDRKAGRLFEVTTDRYADDPSGKENIHGHPGKQFAVDLIEYLATREGPRISLGDPVGEDYGWGFWIEEKGFSPLWVAIAHAGRPDADERAEDYILAITLEPPLLPWRRLAYKPDFALRDEIERQLIEFLHTRRMPFVTEAEDWVDPEPKTQPAPRF